MPDVITNGYGGGSCPSEGAEREALAAYFLTAPPPARQDAAQRARHRAALRRLLRLENHAVLQSAGLPRLLTGGNLAGLLRAVLEASLEAVRLFREEEDVPGLSRFSIHLDPRFPVRQFAGFEPRLLQMAVTGLIRAVLAANRGGAATASLYAGRHTFVFAVSGDRPPDEPEALAVAKEAARLHHGCLAVCETTIGLSISHSLPPDIGRIFVPGAHELLRDPLSLVQIGLYSSLDGGDGVSPAADGDSHNR